MPKLLNFEGEKVEFHTFLARIPKPVYTKLLNLSKNNNCSINAILRYIVGSYFKNHRS